MNLTINVGFRNMVEIDQCQAGYTAARSRLGRPGTYTAQAHHHNVSSPNPLSTFRTVQARKCPEAALNIRAGSVGLVCGRNYYRHIHPLILNPAVNRPVVPAGNRVSDSVISDSSPGFVVAD